MSFESAQLVRAQGELLQGCAHPFGEISGKSLKKMA
jgi:hypothetical protein